MPTKKTASKKKAPKKPEKAYGIISFYAPDRSEMLELIDKLQLMMAVDSRSEVISRAIKLLNKQITQVY